MVCSEHSIVCSEHSAVNPDVRLNCAAVSGSIVSDAGFVAGVSLEYLASVMHNVSWEISTLPAVFFSAV